MTPERFDFENELRDAVVAVLLEDETRRTRTVEGWAGIEEAVADLWPRLSGHQCDAAEFGRHFDRLREVEAWEWDDDGRPSNLTLWSVYGRMTFVPARPGAEMVSGAFTLPSATG